MRGAIQLSSVAGIFDDPERERLFAEYDAECANPLIGSIAPDRAMYEALHSMGMAQCFAAWQDGRLCGFGFVLIAAIPHYGRRFATVESLFVSSTARSGNLGEALMKTLEDGARESGCTAIFYTAPVNSRLAKLLFFKAEYCNTNLIFTKRLA